MSTEKTTAEKIETLTEVLFKYNFRRVEEWLNVDAYTLVFFHNEYVRTLPSEAIDEVKKIIPNAKWKVTIHLKSQTLCLEIWFRRQE